MIQKVLKKKQGYWYIRYVDDDDSWNEWVGPDRIRLKESAVKPEGLIRPER